MTALDIFNVVKALHRGLKRPLQSLAARVNEIHVSVSNDGEQPIAVEFYLVDPMIPLRRFRDERRQLRRDKAWQCVAPLYRQRFGGSSCGCRALFF